MKRLVVVLRQPTRAPGIKMTGITTRATGWWEEGGAICWTASQQHITRSLFWILKIPVLSFYRLYFVDRFISPRFISPIITKALFILKWKFVIFVILAYFTNFWTNKLRNFRYLKGKTKKKINKIRCWLSQSAAAFFKIVYVTESDTGHTSAKAFCKNSWFFHFITFLFTNFSMLRAHLTRCARNGGCQSCTLQRYVLCPLTQNSRLSWVRFSVGNRALYGKSARVHPSPLRHRGKIFVHSLLMYDIKYR